VAKGGGCEGAKLGKDLARAMHGKGDGIEITIDAPELCGRYDGALADVTVGPSPDWMQARLQACGIRPITNIVDITNYVLLELGQPMHAFDLARIRGGQIRGRKAHAQEVMTTLEWPTRTPAAGKRPRADPPRAVAVS